VSWDFVQRELLEKKLREMEASIEGTSATLKRVDGQEVHDKLAAMASRLAYYEYDVQRGFFDLETRQATGADWDESKHPRGPGGKFGAGGGGGAAAARPTGGARGGGAAGGGGGRAAAPAGGGAGAAPAATGSGGGAVATSPAVRSSTAAIDSNSAVVNASNKAGPTASPEAHAAAATYAAASAVAHNTAAAQAAQSQLAAYHVAAAQAMALSAMAQKSAALAKKNRVGKQVQPPYVTNADDSIEDISNRFQLTKTELAIANPGVDVDNLRQGQVLNIPKPGAGVAGGTKKAAGTKAVAAKKAPAAKAPTTENLQNNPAVANMLASMQHNIARLMATAANRAAASGGHADLSKIHAQIIKSVAERAGVPTKAPKKAATTKTMVDIAEGLDLKVLWDFL
jgi:LysM repeat protein